MEIPEQFSLTLDERGRLVLPAPLRRRLDLHPGSRLLATIDADGTIRVTQAREHAAHLYGMYRHVAPGRSLVDDLLAERRADEARESSS